MEKTMKTIRMGYIETTITIHSFIPGYAKVRIRSFEAFRENAHAAKVSGSCPRLRSLLQGLVPFVTICNVIGSLRPPRFSVLGPSDLQPSKCFSEASAGFKCLAQVDPFMSFGGFLTSLIGRVISA